jgi:hypothetical protein
MTSATSVPHDWPSGKGRGGGYHEPVRDTATVDTPELLIQRAIAAWAPPAQDIICEGPYWLAPDGTILDAFTGGHDEAAGGLNANQQALQRAGFARVRAYGDELGIEITRPLTPAQRRVILRSKALRWAKDGIIIDVSDDRGSMVGTESAPGDLFLANSLINRANMLAVQPAVQPVTPPRRRTRAASGRGL